MLARISTTFNCTAQQLWDEIRRPTSLQPAALENAFIHENTESESDQKQHEIKQ
jgi:hypothetical protein